MKDRYLEITFRKGQAVAAYLHLPHASTSRRAGTREIGPGLRVDLSEEGEAMGLEIVSPAVVRAEDLNDALRSLGHPPLSAEELAPIRAA